MNNALYYIRHIDYVWPWKFKDGEEKKIQKKKVKKNDFFFIFYFKFILFI